MRRFFTWFSPLEGLLLAALLGFTYRYFWLMDDAFIYFRYIDNWLFLGRGLVFNDREYVEGYTSPAWLLLLAIVRTSTTDYWAIVRALSLSCAVSYWLALVWINRRLSPSGPTVNLPLALSAAHYGLTSHFSSGLESPLVQIVACAYAAATLQPHCVWLQILVGATPLVRPEFALCVGAWAICYTLSQRRIPGPLLLSVALANGAWLAFRIYYYADLFPNTYYLKDSSQWLQGSHYLRNLLDAHHLHWLFAGLALLAWSKRRALVAPRHALPLPRVTMVVIALCYTVYVVRVGGDMIYYRYLAFPYCLALCATSGIAESSILSSITAPKRRSLTAAAVTLIVSGLTFWGRPDQLLEHPLSIEQETRHSHGIADAMWHRRHGQLKPKASRPAEDAELRARYAAASDRQRAHVAVLVHPWCRRAFFDFDKYIVHSFGLTDAFLARLPAPWSRPGHKDIDEKADQLGKFRGRDGIRRERGAVARWVSEQRVPQWVLRNRAELERVEKRIYNHHDFAANAKLALEPVKMR